MRSQLDPRPPLAGRRHARPRRPDPDVMRVPRAVRRRAPRHAVRAAAPRSPALTNSLFVDGEAVTVELDDEPPVDLSRARRVRSTPTRFRIADVTTMLPAGRLHAQQWDDGPANRAHHRHRSDPARQRVDRRCRARHRRVCALRSCRPSRSRSRSAGAQATIPLRITNTSATRAHRRGPPRVRQVDVPGQRPAVDLPPNATTEVQVDIDRPVERRRPDQRRDPHPVRQPAHRTGRADGPRQQPHRARPGASPSASLLVLATWWLTYFKRRRREHPRAASSAESVGPPSQRVSAEPADQ